MLGSGEILVILFVFLLLFGGKRLPELARSLGLGVREFKNACQGIIEDPSTPLPKDDSKILKKNEEKNKDLNE